MDDDYFLFRVSLGVSICTTVQGWDIPNVSLFGFPLKAGKSKVNIALKTFGVTVGFVGKCKVSIYIYWPDHTPNFKKKKITIFSSKQKIKDFAEFGHKKFSVGGGKEGWVCISACLSLSLSPLLYVFGAHSLESYKYHHFFI